MPRRRDFIFWYFLRSDLVTDCLVHDWNAPRALLSGTSNNHSQLECDSKLSFDFQSWAARLRLEHGFLTTLMVVRACRNLGKMSRLDRWLRDPTVARTKYIYYNLVCLLLNLPPANISTLPRNLKRGAMYQDAITTSTADIIHVA